MAVQAGPLQEGSDEVTSPSDSPVVARRRVRLALRRARDRKQLTQSQVAEAMEWSLSKVMRIEAGEVSISTTDLRALLAYYGITDKTTVERLLEDARSSRRQRWWTDVRYRKHLTPALLQLIQFEAEAVEIRYFNLVLVNGTLQTDEYARAVLANYRDDLSDEDLAVRIETRRLRSQQMFDRPDPPQFLAILDESVLYREVGGREVMGRQLLHLLKMMERRNILVRILPFDKAAPIALLGPFGLLDLSGEEDAILYRESHLQDSIVHNPAEVARHRGIFEELWKRALDDAESERLIKQRAAAMLSGPS